ncbi:MAG: ABC transporter permease [bacterium]|nr:ABC transporter permease [bacterium]
MLDYCKQCVKISVKALLANKARSFLTMLGIIIGVGAVIVIMAVGAGAQSLILAQVKTLGTNLIGVMPGKSEETGPPTAAMGIVITTLTYDDAMALRDPKNAPNIVEVVAYTIGIGTVSWESNSYDTNLKGSTAGYLEVEGGEVGQGRFFTEEEEKNMARVAVLGSAVKNELFGESEAVGQRIKIKKHTFEVIGVMKERGTVAFQDYDDQILLPIKTMQKLIAGVNHLGLIRAKVDDENNIQRAINDVEITLRERHDITDMSGASDDFTVRSAAEALDVITTVTDALRYFLAAMAALSLLVGGIGIMNIMLVSVTERTREIGLRKAVGADNFNIMSQFLMEAVAVTLLGGIIGIVGGVIVSYLIAVGARFLDYEWEFIVSPFSVILAVSVSMLVGLVFGLYPARKASKLEPVEALRYE